ncbi:DedA family protein [Thermovibrio sp.]
MLFGFLKSHLVAFAFLGGFTEGALTIFIGGVLCKVYSLPPFPVFLSAYLGMLLSYQLFFLVGRLLEEEFLVKFPKFEKELSLIEKKFGREFDRLASIFPFIYGAGVVAPIFLGVNGYPYLKFTLRSSLSAFLWALICFSSGYLFGKVGLKYFKAFLTGQLLLLMILFAFTVVFFNLSKLFFKGIARGKA